MVVTSEDGKVEEYISKSPMEKMIVVSNKKWHTTEGGSQLHDREFVNKLGTYGKEPEINHILDGLFQFPAICSVDTKDFLSACTKTKNWFYTK